jgi:rhamnulokinase
LLCQLTADATGLPVIAGPVEATAIGNLLVQAMATGHIADVDELRRIVRGSSPTTLYEPRAGRAQVDDAYGRFKTISADI